MFGLIKLIYSLANSTVEQSTVQRITQDGLSSTIDQLKRTQFCIKRESHACVQRELLN